jgi:tetratricopeptide (TPR) repeat protein
VVSERSFSATTTINGRTFNNNIHTKVVSNIAPISRSFSRPRAFKDGYHYGDRDSGGIHWRRQVHGNRPGVVFRHIVWPSYGYPVYYRHGPDIFFSYFRPSYHRKYIFVSIGNYWPVYYTSLRYYWYGWYPYTWYGCYPTAYEVCGDTYNYYTYNTYNYEFGSSSGYIGSEYSAPLADVDETTFADIRQKLAEQARQQPEDATLTDKFFDDGVEAFEQGDYVKAAAAFADAIALEPNDLILPFAYVQALFACEQYGKAADILRMALVQMPADQQGLFFPRGLYSDDNVLLEQVEKLQDRADVFAYDPDMSLLLGYQLIGIEQYDQARRWLEQAGQYDINNKAVTILLDLLDKLGEQRQDVSQNI